MNNYIINEQYIATKNQEIVTLSKPYIEGSLKVFVNGILTDDYIETDSYNIKFNTPLKRGDKIDISSLYRTDNIKIDVIGVNSKSRNSIFKKYGENDKLQPTSSFDVNISFKNSKYSPIAWNFDSKIEPLLSNVKRIRLDTGDILQTYSDKDILDILYANTKEVLDLYLEYLSSKSENDSTITSYDTVDDMLDDLKTFPRMCINWVRYKTDMDLVNAAYITISAKYGENKKEIGPITADVTVKLPDYSSLLSRFNKLFNQADMQLSQQSLAVASFVKAGDTEYTINNERNSF